MDRIGLTATLATLAACGGAAQAQLTEGFEGAFPPATWVLHNQSTNIAAEGWAQRSFATSGVLQPHSGTFFVRDWYAAVSGSASTGLTISDWLITPQLAISNGTALSFWTESDGQFADRIQIRMSIAGASTNSGVGPTEVGDFTTLLLDINPLYNPGGATGYPVVWTQYTLPVTGLVGAQSGRFAFRYFVEDAGINGVHSSYVGLDDVAVVTGVEPPPGCYANCDHSTAVPFLHVQDFGCFLAKFAGGDAYANCDGSTTVPTLNVQDFGCFLTKFATGCSAP